MFSLFLKDLIQLQKICQEKFHTRRKKIRSKRLIALSEKKNLKFNKLNIGQITNVLFERTR